jgi:hypothetical protein
VARGEVGCIIAVSIVLKEYGTEPKTSMMTFASESTCDNAAAAGGVRECQIDEVGQRNHFFAPKNVRELETTCGLWPVATQPCLPKPSASHDRLLWVQPVHCVPSLKPTVLIIIIPRSELTEKTHKETQIHDCRCLWEHTGALTAPCCRRHGTGC